MATVTGGTGIDVQIGTDIAEGLFGGSGSDMAFGAGGNDHLLGGSGNDFLGGGDDNDWLEGGSGNDVLDGGAGHDGLTGGKGNDLLNGGEGNDTFIFGAKSGKDTITDFSLEGDVLKIEGVKGFNKAKDVIKHAKQLKNGDVEINLGKGNKIILKDVSLKELKKNPSDHFDVS
jgi:Ca2+-binding RTX toxin-like protein